jgi:hypothetical protein
LPDSSSKDIIMPAIQPINYTALQPRPDFGQDMLEGLKLGATVRDIKTKREAEEKAKKLQEQYAADLKTTFDNPTAEAFAALSAKYPQQREAYKQSWDMMKEGQRDQEFSAGVQAYGAIQAGRPEVAAELLDARIAAKKNSGQDATKLETMRKMLDSDPKTIASHLGLSLSAIDPDRWSKMTGELRAAQKAPSELSESQAKAAKAAVDAQFAESNAVMDLQKKGWDITKIQEDIKIAKENSRIAALNAATSREGNQLKRVELATKLQEAKDKRDEAVRAKAADVESARGNMDNMLNTADRILKTPMGVVGSAAGPVSSRIMTTSQDTADFEALVETLGSQSFLAQIPNIKGMGALSNAEGEKLQAALQNFSLKQSPERLLENVREAQRLILKGRANLTKRYGVPEVIPDTPAAAPSANEIDSLLKKYGAQ